MPPLELGADVDNATGSVLAHRLDRRRDRTLEYRPTDNLSLRLEHRHDHADDKVYFGGAVALDPEMTPISDRRSQDTLTAGITAWR